LDTHGTSSLPAVDAIIILKADGLKDWTVHLWNRHKRVYLNIFNILNYKCYSIFKMFGNEQFTDEINEKWLNL